MGLGSGFFGDLNQAAPSGAFLRGLRPISAAFSGTPILFTFGTSGPRLLAPPCPSPGMVARGGGMSGVALIAGALRARGQGGTCGEAWEWAEPTARERARTRGMGWASGFSGNSTILSLVTLPCCAFGTYLPRLRRCPALSVLAESGGQCSCGRWNGWGWWILALGGWRYRMGPFCRSLSPGSMDAFSVLGGESYVRCSGSQCVSGEKGSLWRDGPRRAERSNGYGRITPLRRPGPNPESRPSAKEISRTCRPTGKAPDLPHRKPSPPQPPTPHPATNAAGWKIMTGFI